MIGSAINSAAHATHFRVGAGGGFLGSAALAWNLKSWCALLVPNRERGIELVKMEFRRFLSAVMLLPCQIVCTARRVIYRILGYNRCLVDLLATWERLERFYTG
jgi:hypothetical protein